MRLRGPFVLLALVGLVVGSPAHAQKLSAQSETISIGETRLVVPAPEGFCFMNRTQMPDARVFQLLQGTIGTTNTLFAILAKCDQLKRWRTGKKATLDDLVQVQSLTRTLNRKIPGPRTAVAKQICAQLAKMKQDKTAETVFEGARKSVKALSKTIRLGEVKFLGQIEEPGDACYGGLIKSIKTELGTKKVVLTVFAATTIKSKLIYYYRERVYDAPEQLKASLDLLKADVKQLIAANPG